MNRVSASPLRTWRRAARARWLLVAVFAAAAPLHAVTLAWTDRSQNESGFHVLRGPRAPALETLATVPANTTTYADTSVEPGRSYVYAVTAFNDGGESAPTNTVSVAAPVFVLDLPDRGAAAIYARFDGSVSVLVSLPAASIVARGTFVLQADGTFSGALVRVGAGTTAPALALTAKIDGTRLTGSITGLPVAVALTAEANTAGPIPAGWFDAGSAETRAQIIVSPSGDYLAVTESAQTADVVRSVVGRAATSQSGQSAELTLSSAAAVSLRLGSTTLTGAREGAATGGRLINLSVRSVAAPGDETLIAGFTLSGAAADGRILLRGVGPALATFAVSGLASDPLLTLFNNRAVVGTNDDWDTAGDRAAVANAATAVGAFPLAAGSRDAALLATVRPGTFTAHVTTKNATSGIALVEIYDVARFEGTALTNLSARTRAGRAGESLVAGFVVGGNGPVRLLVRAVGPTLTQLGVASAHPDPRVTVFNGATEIAANDNWGGSETLTLAAAQAGAFALPRDSRDAALVLTAFPGAYTAVVSGPAEQTGIVLVEIYQL